MQKVLIITYDFKIITINELSASSAFAEKDGKCNKLIDAYFIKNKPESMYTHMPEALQEMLEDGMLKDEVEVALTDGLHKIEPIFKSNMFKKPFCITSGKSAKIQIPMNY